MPRRFLIFYPFPITCYIDCSIDFFENCNSKRNWSTYTNPATGIWSYLAGYCWSRSFLAGKKKKYCAMSRMATKMHTHTKIVRLIIMIQTGEESRRSHAASQPARPGPVHHLPPRNKSLLLLNRWKMTFPIPGPSSIFSSKTRSERFQMHHKLNLLFGQCWMCYCHEYGRHSTCTSPAAASPAAAAATAATASVAAAALLRNAHVMLKMSIFNLWCDINDECCNFRFFFAQDVAWEYRCRRRRWRQRCRRRVVMKYCQVQSAM